MKPVATHRSGLVPNCMMIVSYFLKLCHLKLQLLCHTHPTDEAGGIIFLVVCPSVHACVLYIHMYMWTCVRYVHKEGTETM